MWKGLFIALVPALLGCGGPQAEITLCQQTFAPYPDLITGRARTSANGLYLDAMAHYATGNYAEAREGLQTFLNSQIEDRTAYIYLACSYLAMGEPYEAELQLDHLKRNSTLQYNDQISWYRVVCWVCSDQLDRAREGAQRIASSKAHTYANEAAALLKALEASPK